MKYLSLLRTWNIGLGHRMDRHTDGKKDGQINLERHYIPIQIKTLK